MIKYEVWFHLCAADGTNHRIGGRDKTRAAKSSLELLNLVNIQKTIDILFSSCH